MNISRNILLVDDDISYSNVLKKILENYNYNVNAVYSGEEALDYVENNYKSLGLILLDVMLPNINGYEVCRRLKLDKRYNFIPIIFLTGRGGKEDKIEGIRVGADEYLTKPVDVKAFLSKADSVMKQKEEDVSSRGIKHSVSLTFESSYEFLKEVNHLLTQIYLASNLSPEELDDMRLAFCEIGVNAIEHGNLEDPSKTVNVTYNIYEDRLELIIEDEGSGFVLEAVGQPTEDENILKGRGRGIFITRKLVDELRYEKGGKRAVMIKFFGKK